VKLYPVRDDTVVLSALLHDVCKADVYKTDYRNQKNEMGQWEKVPYIKFDDLVPLGHGDKSVILIQQHFRLTLEEAIMIRWHMGSQPDQYGRTDGFANACKICPAASLLHAADSIAAFVLERDG
jgi:hypothetical protein